ncbi:MAG: hypothetical protein ABSB94_22260 [Syntrophorhabdales bacterium]|jgi:hypothetical protein
MGCLSGAPCRAYAVYLARKHTALSNAEIGAYFGNITFSAVTKTVSRLSARMKEDRTMRKEVDMLVEKLPSVKGLTHSPHRFSNDRNACRKFQVLV